MNGYIDQKALDRLKVTCVRIRTKTKAGTGFLVAPNLVMTCGHVVSDALGDGAITCTLDGVPPRERSASLVTPDHLHDVAVLRLATPVEDTPLVIDGSELAGGWTSFAYPAFAHGAGTALTGNINDWHSNDPDQHPAVALWSEMFNGQLPALGGISGSPVVIDGKAVAMFYRVLGADGARQIPQLGLSYAIPGEFLEEALAEALGRPFTRAHARRNGLGTPYAVTEARVASLYAIATAPTSGAVHEALAKLAAPSIDAATLVAAERLIGLGCPEDAQPLLEGLSESNRRQQLLALALSLDGKHREAQSVLRQLVPSAETAGIEGGVLKRRWLETGNDAWLEASYDAYRVAYDREEDAYTGINVAALALSRGEAEESSRVASEVRVIVEAVADANRSSWDWASLGEAYLLLRDLTAARAAYARAAKEARGATRDVAIMRRQARRNLVALGMGEHAVDDVLPVGAVASIAPGAAYGGDNAGSIEGRLREQIKTTAIRIVVGCPWSNTERTILRIAIEEGCEVHVVLPAPRLAVTQGLDGDARLDLETLLDAIDAPRRIVEMSDTPPSDWESAIGDARAGATDLATKLAASFDERPIVLS